MPADSQSPAVRPVAFRGFYAAAGKRLLDLLLAGGAIVLFLPFWLLLALMVRIQMGSPVLFRQERPGKDGRPFTLFKFRSMTQARGADGALLPDDQRLTRFGRLLRASSFDELPELLNIVRGEMSLVGPRPLLVRYLALYTPSQARRHEVRPGLTGWAQINGRNDIPISKRIELDVWYVDHLSLRLDLRIILLTVPRVLRSRGVAVAERDDAMDLGPKDH
jgi:lipopolysaccharide/colanic/teichoic acid biosynthesis glycosyltransferase